MITLAILHMTPIERRENLMNLQMIKTLILSDELLRDLIADFYERALAHLNDYGTDANGDTIPPKLLLADTFDPALTGDPANDDEFTRELRPLIRDIDHYDATESTAYEIDLRLAELNIIADEHQPLTEPIWKILEQLFDLYEEQRNATMN